MRHTPEKVSQKHTYLHEPIMKMWSKSIYVSIIEVTDHTKITKTSKNWTGLLFFQKDSLWRRGTFYLHIFVTSYSINFQKRSEGLRWKKFSWICGQILERWVSFLWVHVSSETFFISIVFKNNCNGFFLPNQINTVPNASKF